MGILFAGLLNTGIVGKSKPPNAVENHILTLGAKTACWTLIDLAVHDEWRAKCKKEIEDLLARHTGNSASFVTTYDKLSAIPVSAWEDELPIIEACTRESQRLSFTGAALRRNVREDITINGKLVRRGDFLTYPISEVHLNPEFYPNPHKYDPGRWLRPDPVPNVVYPYLGWGAGRHPCPGMKVAKLEMKLITAMFLMRYEYKLVDESGKFPKSLPVPNRNDIHQVSEGWRRMRFAFVLIGSLLPPSIQSRPLGARSYFDFKKTME